MSFTELILEWVDPEHPLCRITSLDRTAHGVWRMLDDGRVTGRFEDVTTLSGSPASRDTLQRARPSAAVLNDGEPVVALHERIAVNEAPEYASRLLRVLDPLRRVGALACEPIRARDGRLRSRIVIAARAQDAATATAIYAAQEAAMLREFRVVRTAPLDPARHLESLRPLLNSDQDSLLRLAVSMGYYDNPKRANLDVIAKAVGLTISPVHKRLKAAEELIVATRVSGSPSSLKVKRPRRSGLAFEGSGPFEVDVRVRASDHPLARFVTLNAHSRALLVPICGTQNIDQGRNLVAVAANSTARADLLADLRAGAALEARVVSDGEGQGAYEVAGRIEDGWSLRPILDGFGADMHVRHLLFEGGVTYVRLGFLRTVDVADVETRLQKVAPTVGWADPEVLAIRAGHAAHVPLDLPEPLSPRQEEVIRVAHALGYYRTPRECTLETIASTLSVSANAIHKNLVTAESKIIGAHLSTTL